MSNGRHNYAGSSRKVENNTPRLYTTTEFADELGISSMTLLYWVDRGSFDPPAFLCGKKDQRLWHWESIERAKKDYELLQQNATGRASAHHISKKDEKAVQEIIKEDDLPICSLCNDPVFDMTMHNRFKHANELSVTRGKASW